MNQDYSVKGSSIRTKLQFVREKFGDEAEQDLKSRFDRKIFPILDSSWYPFTLNEQVSRAIVDTHLGGDSSRLREVGSYSAEKVLTSVYKLFTSGKSFVDFLRRAEMLHETCYNQGGMGVEVADDGKSCTINLRAPHFSEADMHVAAGFYIGAAELLGEKNVTCESTPEYGGAIYHMKWG